MDEKIIKVQRHYPYSQKITLPKEFCQALNIDDESWLKIMLDEKNQRLILKLERKAHE